jgi:hypothetical protein
VLESGQVLAGAQAPEQGALRLDVPVMGRGGFADASIIADRAGQPEVMPAGRQPRRVRRAGPGSPAPCLPAGGAGVGVPHRVLRVAQRHTGDQPGSTEGPAQGRGSVAPWTTTPPGWLARTR